mmetsp:Transcript_32011/g.51504  ORF Transcript_32011/g.51504 Transcript_32011/m.51504 type:complete len:203 (-) Transcript_32011:465-1073(-)
MIGILLGCAVALFLDALDLCLELRLGLGVAVGDACADGLAVPVNLVHAVLHGFPVCSYLVVHILLSTRSPSLFVCQACLSAPLGFCVRSRHLIFALLALPGVLTVIVLLLLLHPQSFAFKPSRCQILISLLFVLLGLPPAVDSSHTLIVDLLHLDLLDFVSVLLRCCYTSVLLDLVEHVLSTLFFVSSLLVLHPVKLHHLCI